MDFTGGIATDLAERLVSLQHERDLQGFLIHLQALLRDYRQIDRIELLWNQVQGTEDGSSEPLRQGHDHRIQSLNRNPKHLVPLLPAQWQPANEQRRNAEARTDLLQVADWLITGWETSTGGNAPPSFEDYLEANPYVIPRAAPSSIATSVDNSLMEGIEGGVSPTSDSAETGRSTLTIASHGGYPSTDLISLTSPESAGTSEGARSGPGHETNSSSASGIHKGSAYVKATRIKISSAAIEEIGRLRRKGFSILAKIFLDCEKSSPGERIRFFQQLRSYVLAERSLPASVSLTRRNREAAAAEFRRSAIVLFSREEEEQGEQADIDILTKLLRLRWEQLGARDYDKFCKSCQAVGTESRVTRSAGTGEDQWQQEFQPATFHTDSASILSTTVDRRLSRYSGAAVSESCSNSSISLGQPILSLCGLPPSARFKPQDHRRMKRWNPKKVTAARAIIESLVNQLPPEWTALLREDDPTRYYDRLTGSRGRVPPLPSYTVERLAPEDRRLLKQCAELIVQDGDTAQEAVIADWLKLRYLQKGRGAGFIYNELRTYMEQFKQTVASDADSNNPAFILQSDDTFYTMAPTDNVANTLIPQAIEQSFRQTIDTEDTRVGSTERSYEAFGMAETTQTASSGLKRLKRA